MLSLFALMAAEVYVFGQYFGIFSRNQWKDVGNDKQVKQQAAVMVSLD